MKMNENWQETLEKCIRLGSKLEKEMNAGAGPGCRRSLTLLMAQMSCLGRKAQSGSGGATTKLTDHGEVCVAVWIGLDFDQPWWFN